MIWPFNKLFGCKHDYGEYGTLHYYGEDGIGRVHARVRQKCYYCGHQKEVCLTHIPKWVRTYKYREER